MRNYKTEILVGENKIPFEFTPTNGTHVAVDIPRITIFKVLYRVVFHLYRIGTESEQWSLKSDHTADAPYLDRLGSPLSGPSPAARKKVTELLVPLAAEWIKGNPLAIAEAHRDDLESSMDRAKTQKAEAEKAAQEAEETISDLLSQLNRANQYIRHIKNPG